MPRTQKNKLVLGVISDTHGPLTGEAAAALEGVDYIVHAGDVVDPGAVLTLRHIAPTTAVLGNMDGYEVNKELNLSRTAVVELGGVFLYVLHDLSHIDIDPRVAGFAAIIHGHLHRPEIEWKDGVLYLNPGSAGPARSSRKPSVAHLTIEDGRLTPKIILLD
ncbi:MAG: metallophosphoesterase family protein [Deltaproteobacteria bacterium]|nr:metallophosphoesterase family protein [Deltaproteobacteria bacterium]